MTRFTLKLLSPLLLLLTACGGGGGGGDGGNACQELDAKLKNYFDTIEEKNNKIINGNVCNSNGSPIVRIHIHTADGQEYICSGTVISSDSVLTAAHCVTNYNKNSSVYRISVLQGEMWYTVKDWYWPKLYNSGSDREFISEMGVDVSSYDIAIIKINGTFAVNPVPIMTKIVSGKAIIAGYGKDEHGNSGILRAAYAKIYRNHQSVVTTRYDDTDTQVCFGDSGGPMFIRVNGQLAVYGITSMGNGTPDCKDGDITSYTALYNIYPFIQQLTSVSTF